MGSVLIISVLVTTWIFLKYDDLTAQDLGLDFQFSSIYKFSISLMIGILIFGLFFLIYYWLTPIKFVTLESVNVVQTTIIILILFIALGAMEEIVFRGYFLKKLDSIIGVRAAIYVTSIAFGLYHGITIDSITGPAIWGLIYGVLTYWSKGLAVPIGFHVGVNMIQGLLNQKEKWVDGVWSIELVDSLSPFTIEQVTWALQITMLIIGLILVEYYLRVVRHRE
jgi:membrane protease YdiL (CAAX protease family)